MVRYTNLKFLYYLNFCDLINKYCYNTFFALPYIYKLRFMLFIKGLLNKAFKKLYLNMSIFLHLTCFGFGITRLNYLLKKNFLSKLYLSYFVLKQNILINIFNFLFLLQRFSRALNYSFSPFFVSKSSGKIKKCQSCISVFLPASAVISNIDQQRFFNFKTLKFFVFFFLRHFICEKFYNFFKLQFDVKYHINSNLLNNILLFWFLR